MHRGAAVPPRRDPRRCTILAEDGGLVGFANTILGADPRWGALLENLRGGDCDAVTLSGTRPSRRHPMTTIRTSLSLLAASLVAGGLATLTSPWARASTQPARAAAPSPRPAPDQAHGLAGTAPFDVGVFTAYCPGGRGRRSSRTAARAASTSEAGWPAKECLKMDRGAAGREHTLVGLDGVHNWLLGGYGNDTIVGGDRGDVIWGDYHPSGEPRSQTVTIYAGNGRNVIYANDTHNYVWTGTDPHTIVHAHVSGISGVIHCQSPGVVVYLSTVSERHFSLDGCRHVSHYSVGY